MRTLHIDAGNLYGGVERLLVTLARHRGACPEMEPSFAGCFRGRLSSELAEQGTPLVDLGQVRASRPWTVWRARRRLAAYLQASAPDVVVCHMPWTYGLLGPVARRLGLPVVLWVHGPLQPARWPDRLARRHRPSLVIANSFFTARTVPRVFSSVPTEVVYCPVALEPGSPADRGRLRAEFATAPDAVVIVQVARMEAWKGHLSLLRALARLKDVPRWMAWQVGGPQRPAEARYLDDLRREADALGIADRVRFVGARSDVAAVLRASDVYCHPNTGPEPFGISLVEAMLAGLPVVATDAGAIPEVLHESCAVVVPAQDVAALGAALRRLVERSDLRAALAAAAPAHARAIADAQMQMRRLSAALHGVAPERRVLESRDA